MKDSDKRASAATRPSDSSTSDDDPSCDPVPNCSSISPACFFFGSHRTHHYFCSVALDALLLGYLVGLLQTLPIFSPPTGLGRAWPRTISTSEGFAFLKPTANDLFEDGIFSRLRLVLVMEQRNLRCAPGMPWRGRSGYPSNPSELRSRGPISCATRSYPSQEAAIFFLPSSFPTNN